MYKSLVTLFVLVLCLTIAPQVTSAHTSQAPSFTVKTITLKNQPAYDVKISPNGQTAAVYYGRIALNYLNVPIAEYKVDPLGLPIRLVDLTSGNDLGQLTGATDYINDVVFSPDGKQLASLHRNGEILLWDLAAKQLTKRITAFTSLDKLEYLTDGKTLVTQSNMNPGFFALWDVGTGYMTRIWRGPFKSFGEVNISKTPDNFVYRYVDFDIAPDGKHFASVSGLGQIELWDTGTLQRVVVRKAPDDAKQRLQAVLSVRSVKFSADGKALVYFDTPSGQTHFWDVASQKETTALTAGAGFFDIDPKLDMLAWARPNKVFLADVKQPDQAAEVLDVSKDELIGMAELAFTPDGKQLVAGGFLSHKSDNSNLLYIISLQ